ncbi:MAG: M20/M25/M40 family metallo-hydrolase, partial [Lachnospiraceae bacterium]|nr:M20/M25/M40 family metallo-hydrolase [Lachnospiraceae bacterium]
MMEIKNLPLTESAAAFRYFEEICQIPHGSKNIWQISQYLVDFANRHRLAVRQDELGNVIIKKAASAGYESAPTVMLQGHMDMVCIKDADSRHNFETDPLDIYVEDGYLKARGTTLGGDDGVAVAYAMALLADNSLAHPALEVVITVDEEIGLLGAAGLDVKDLNAKILLNLDSEEEGIFLTGCAGGRKSAAHFPLEQEKVNGTKLWISIGGLS